MLIFRKITLGHDLYTLSGICQSDGCRCPGVNLAPGHQQPLYWLCYDDNVIWNLSRNTHFALQWRHIERDCVSYHQTYDCLINRLFRLFRHRCNKTSKFRVTGLSEGNSLVTSEFRAQRAINVQCVPFDDVIMALKFGSGPYSTPRWFPYWDHSGSGLR